MVKKIAKDGITIVKRKGHTEKFDDKKVYASVYAACASAHYHEGKCEQMSSMVLKSINNFVKGKKQISSGQIRKKIMLELKKKDGDLVFYYEHHLPNLRKL